MPDTADAALTLVTADQFDEIDAILDDLRTRNDETPQWEFCEGVLAALVCCRRAIAPDEYLELLLGVAPQGEEDADRYEGAFADAAQRERFMAIWNARWSEVATALAADIHSLDEEAAYQPEVMDVRGAIAELSEAERADIGEDAIPAFAQVWALGFMFAVENWPQEWVAPRDKDAAKLLDAALQAMVALTEDDTGALEVSPFSDDAPPSMSQARVDAFANAVWAVYDVFELWRSIGPRVETVRKDAGPGRNDACPCGSGKKFKKCCAV
ncbi:MAG: UPF0149 family protein [Betaproteobacteria bacterium]